MNLTDLLNALDGSALPGGCDTCNAEQQLSRIGHVTHITIHHDDDCPTWKQIQHRRNHA